MIFEPYDDERAVMRRIHRHAGTSDYAIIRVTQTMVDKNNIDANGLFRLFLEDAGVVDYNALPPGGANKEVTEAVFIQADREDPFELRMYTVAGSGGRSDRRFSIETFAQKVREHRIEVDDLLYFCTRNRPDGTHQICMIDVTHNIPNDISLQHCFGRDATQQALDELREQLRSVVQGGPYANVKGVGNISPKDAGDTFESLMGIKTNNDPGADYHGLIEFKTKLAKTLDTLFTLRPRFDGTPIADYEPNDRSRVSAFARKYGYESEKHPGQQSLYITIASEQAPRNGQGFYLQVDYDLRRVNLMHHEPAGDIVTAYWNFVELRQELENKHPATLWVTAEVVQSGTTSRVALFRYTQAGFSQTPQFTTFLTLIEQGIISYDWRGYTSPTGSYVGKNHGNAWRIDRRYKDELFDRMEILDLGL